MGHRPSSPDTIGASSATASSSASGGTIYERISKAPHQEATMTQPEDGFVKEFERALNRHDLDATLSLIDKQAIYLFSDESVHVGEKAIDRAIRHNFSTINDDTDSIDNLTWLAKSERPVAIIRT